MNKIAFIPLLMIIAGCSSQPAESAPAPAPAPAPLDLTVQSLQGTWESLPGTADAHKISLVFQGEKLTITFIADPDTPATEVKYLGIVTLKNGTKAAVYDLKALSGKLSAYRVEGNTLHENVRDTKEEFADAEGSGDTYNKK